MQTGSRVTTGLMWTQVWLITAIILIVWVTDTGFTAHVTLWHAEQMAKIIQT